MPRTYEGFRPLQQEKRILKFNSETPTIALAAVALYLGTLFEMGCFYYFGIEFLSLAGVTDWLFSIGVSGLFLLPIGSMIVAAASATEDVISRKRTRPVLFFLLSIPPLFVTVTLAIMKKSPVAAGFAIAIVLFVDAVGMLRLSRIFKSDDHPTASWLPLALGVFVASTFSLTSGAIYASSIAGRECRFSFKDGRVATMRYMRSLADGHLAMIKDTRYYIPRTEVTELSCRITGR